VLIVVVVFEDVNIGSKDVEWRSWRNLGGGRATTTSLYNIGHLASPPYTAIYSLSSCEEYLIVTADVTVS